MSQSRQELEAVKQAKFAMLWRTLSVLPWWEDKKETARAIFNLGWDSATEETFEQVRMHMESGRI